MKTSAVVLAVLLAATGAALAGDGAAKQKGPYAQQRVLQEKPVLDRRPTGSVKRVVTDSTLELTSDKAVTDTDRKLGIDVSPWMMPLAH